MTSPGGPRRPAGRVLIIDDSEIALALAEDALVQAGYEVKCVKFPNKADPLTLIVANFRPDLVLADVEMPLLRGDDFVRIAKTSPAFKSMKFYFYSSLAPDKLESFVGEVAADGFIPKSDDLTSVVRRVREILGR